MNWEIILAPCLSSPYCPGHAPRIASRRPRANHAGLTPSPQGIHMTQDLYYSVGNKQDIGSNTFANLDF